jgi:hypothetical protein
VNRNVSLKHNNFTAFLAKSYFNLKIRRLEKIIFTATTGRSGTLTLTNVFSSIADCKALHEPYPRMSGAVLTAASFGNMEYVDRVYRQIKAVHIRRAAAGYKYYVETSHLFIKTFALQALSDFGIKLNVIHLVRPPLQVAMSIYRLQDQPGTQRGNQMWLDYRAPSNLIGIADILEADAEFSHPFYKALWYWFEVEARIAAYKERFPSVPFVRFETDWVNDKKRVFGLLNDLSMDFDESAVGATVGARANAREHHKKMGPLDEEKAASMLKRFKTLLNEKGFARPSI